MDRFAGIDLGASKCVISVVDGRGRLLARESFPPDQVGLQALLTVLRRTTSTSKRNLAVAVEDPHSLVSIAVAQHGYCVVPVHPVALARFRLRTAPTGTKSDAGDSLALANIVRVESGVHRPLSTSSAELQALQAITRVRAHTARRRASLERVMRHELALYYQGALKAFPSLASRDAQITLRLAPTPMDARRLSASRLAQELKGAGRRKRPRDRATEILSKLTSPQLRLHPVAEEGHGAALRALLDQHAALSATIESLDEQAIGRASDHPHWHIYASFPALSRVTGATLLGEIGDDLARFSSSRGLLALAGISPVTRASGSILVVKRRRIHNRRLGDAVMAWAPQLLLHSDPALALYKQRRELGDRHHAALRRVAARYLAALYACITNQSEYDEGRLARRVQMPEGAKIPVGYQAARRLKYEPLREYLAEQWPAVVKLAFADVQRLVPGGLPPSAYEYKVWWKSQHVATLAQARAWRSAGYRVATVRLAEQIVEFEPLETAATAAVPDGVRLLASAEGVSTNDDFLPESSAMPVALGVMTPGA